jgi:hypothetical protein
MVAATVEGLGGLEVAVNNAAGGGRAALEIEIPPKKLVKPHNHVREDESTRVMPAPLASGSGPDAGGR